MDKNDIIIRRETSVDCREVENMAREAFWNLSKPGCDEHFFIHTIRQHEDFVPELDFVAEADGQIVGSIMYCKALLRDEKGSEKVILTMGPLCVRPGFQRMGIGKTLLEHTFALAEKMGYDTVINFGNPDNYVARGYKSCKRYNVCFEGGIFPAALLVKTLRDDVFDGRRWFYYPSEVDAPCGDTEALEQFDKLFPPKVKGWQPSQEEFFIHSHSVIRD